MEAAPGAHTFQSVSHEQALVDASPCACAPSVNQETKHCRRVVTDSIHRHWLLSICVCEGCNDLGPSNSLARDCLKTLWKDPPDAVRWQSYGGARWHARQVACPKCGCLTTCVEFLRQCIFVCLSCCFFVVLRHIRRMLTNACNLVCVHKNARRNATKAATRASMGSSTSTWGRVATEDGELQNW